MKNKITAMRTLLNEWKACDISDIEQKDTNIEKPLTESIEDKLVLTIRIKAETAYDMDEAKNAVETHITEMIDELFEGMEINAETV